MKNKDAALYYDITHEVIKVEDAREQLNKIKMNVYLVSGLNYLVIFTILSILNQTQGNSNFIKWVFLSSLLICYLETEYKLNPEYD